MAAHMEEQMDEVQLQLQGGIIISEASSPSTSTTSTNLSLAGGGAFASTTASSVEAIKGGSSAHCEEMTKMIDQAINAVGTFAVTKILTTDHNYWHGWTLFKIVRYAPLHNWNAYEEPLKTNPVLAKMMISGIVYSISDWIWQALFPFDDWWVVPVKVAFDQTLWSALWNSIYYLVLGLLCLESPITTFSKLKATFWPMHTHSSSKEPEEMNCGCVGL